MSRILNNDKTFSVHEDTRKRVFEIVEMFNYKPIRKREKKNNMKSIGLLLARSQQEEFNDLYFLSIREGIEKQCAEMGIYISNVIRASGKIIEFDANGFEGLIIVGNIDLSDVNRVFHDIPNIVFVDWCPNSEFDSVLSNLGSAMKNVLEYLFKLGHENVGFIGGRGSCKKLGSQLQLLEATEERKAVYEQIMKERGCFNCQHVYIGEWNSADGYELMKKAIYTGNMPTAFIVASDPIAIGVLRALNEANIKIPEDVAVVSFNDIEANAAYLQPPLTSVKIYTEQMGRMAVNVLLERFQGRTFPIQIRLPTKLIVRETCGGKPDEHCNFII